MGVTLKYPYIGYDRHGERYSGKEDKQLFFLPLLPGPAAHLQMMMEGRHAEDAPALASQFPGELEIADLDDVGEGLDDEAFGGVEIIKEKAQQAADHGGGEDAQLLEAAAPGQGDDSEEQENRDRSAGGEAVHPVGDVDGVDRADDDKGGEDEIQPLRHADAAAGEGHVQHRVDETEVSHQDDEGQRRGQTAARRYAQSGRAAYRQSRR